MSNQVPAPPSWELLFDSRRETDLGEYRLLERIPINIDWLKWFIILKLSKSPDGRKTLKDMFNNFLETERRIIVALAQSGAGNQIVAWNYSHIIAQMLEHNYMIRKGGAKSIVDGASWLTAANVLSDLLSGFAVPETLQYAVGGK